MTPSQLLKEVEQKIPILKNFQLQVSSLDEKSCRTQAPLQININHKGTAFGGSLYVCGVASCYIYLYNLLRKNSYLNDYDIVIAKADIQYLKPVSKDFQVLVTPARDVVLEPQRKIFLSAEIRENTSSPLACLFKGEFVLVKK